MWRRRMRQGQKHIYKRDYEVETIRTTSKQERAVSADGPTALGRISGRECRAAQIKMQKKIFFCRAY